MLKSRVFRTLVYAVATAAWLAAVGLVLILRPYSPRAQYPGSLDVMAAAPDATLVAGLDNQQRLCVWDPATERQNPATGRQALGPAYIYRCIVLSPDLKTALVVGGPATLRDLAASGTSSAGQFPLLAEGSAQLWEQKSVFPTVAGRMDKLWYSPDGRVLFTHRDFPYDSRTILEQMLGTSERADLFVIDASTGKHLIEMRHTRLLPGALSKGTFATWTRGPVYVWDLPPRRNLVRIASLALSLRCRSFWRPAGSTGEGRKHRHGG